MELFDLCCLAMMTVFEQADEFCQVSLFGEIQIPREVYPAE